MQTIHERVKALDARCEVSEVYFVGRFTLIQMQYARKDIGVLTGEGVACCSDEDLKIYTPERGQQVARNKAVRAILYKLRGRKISHPFMG